MSFGIMFHRPRERFPGGNSVIGRCFLLDLPSKGKSGKATDRCTSPPETIASGILARYRARSVIAVMDCNNVRVVPPKIICQSQECV